MRHKILVIKYHLLYNYNMSRQTFEDIVTGQLPPDQWYELGLHHLYEHLEPASEVGSLAFDLATERVHASQEWAEAYSLTNNGEDESAGPQLKETSLAFLLAEDRQSTFLKLYLGIAAGLAERKPHRRVKGYEAVVREACKEQRNSVSGNQNLLVIKPEAVPGHQANLTNLINESAVLYCAERGLHFANMLGSISLSGGGKLR
jgi:hypothetical protein